MILETLVVGPKSFGAPTAMVFVLHGRGANDRDLVPFAAALECDTLRYVFVNAPLKVPGMAEGREWYRFAASHDEDIEESTERLIKTIDAQAGEAPIVLAGFSQGAVLALSAGLRRLPPPKGIVALSGYFARSGGLSARRGASYPPVLVTHGTEDSVIPVQWGREARQTLKGLGVPVQYQEFPIGHQIDRSVLRTVQNFLKETLIL